MDGAGTNGFDTLAALDESGDARIEEIVAMAGATRRHNMLCGGSTTRSDRCSATDGASSAST